MAGSSMTFTYDETGPIKKIKIDWLSDSSAGTASGTTKKISGRLLKGVTDPGSAAPSPRPDEHCTGEGPPPSSSSSPGAPGASVQV